MHIKGKIQWIVLVVAVGVFCYFSIRQMGDAHVLYYVQELELYVRLSPIDKNRKSALLVFSRNRDSLPTRHSDVLAAKYDNIWISDIENYAPIIRIKKGQIDTIYTTETPHSVSIPMEELFTTLVHYFPVNKKEQLSELPGFVISFSYEGIKQRHILNSIDDRLTFIELERVNY